MTLFSSLIEQDNSKKVLRSHTFVKPPAHFNMSACSCGLTESEWSKYRNHLWCPACRADFIPEATGILAGPLDLSTCKLLGICFDRKVEATGRIERFSYDTGQWVPV